jgi:biopolymer transport protein ExbD
MKINRRKLRTAEVYTASLNDIMFFLLLFFLIVSTMATPTVLRVNLPKSSTSQEAVVKKNISLTVTSDLRYFIDDKQVFIEEIEPVLSAMLTAAQQKNEKPSVIIRADRALSIQDLINVIDIGNKLKIQMVLFADKNK